MSIAYLTADEMVALSHPWVAPVGGTGPTLRPVLEQLPGVRDMVPLLAAATEELRLFSRQPRTRSAALQDLARSLQETDAQHDRLARWLHGQLALIAEFTEDLGLRARLQQLRERMFPNGLAVVNWHYAREAGAALRLEGRLSPEDRALLDELRVGFPGGGGTLREATDALLQAGHQLARLEESRSKQMQEEGPDPRGGANEQHLKNRWMSLVSTIEQLLRLAPAPEEVEQQLVLPLQEAIRRASLRQAAKKEEPAVGAGGTEA